MSGLHQLSVKESYQLGVHHFKSQRLGGIFVFLFLVSKMSIPCLTPYRKINSNESMTYMWVNQNLSDIQLHSQKEKGKKERTQSWRGSWKALDQTVEKLEALCLVHCWWENKIVQPLWKPVWVPQNLNRVTTGSSNCKFGHATQRIESRVSNCLSMFIAALYAMTKRRKHSKCPSTDEWINKMRYIRTTYA